jgi:hypothetical protein
VTGDQLALPLDAPPVEEPAPQIDGDDHEAMMERQKAALALLRNGEIEGWQALELTVWPSDGVLETQQRRAA